MRKPPGRGPLNRTICTSPYIVHHEAVLDNRHPRERGPSGYVYYFKGPILQLPAVRRPYILSICGRLEHLWSTGTHVGSTGLSRTPSLEGLFCLQPYSAPPNTKRDWPGDLSHQVSRKSQRVRAQPLSPPSVCYLSQPPYKSSASSACHPERWWVRKDRVGNTQNVRARHGSQ